ncbi:MAG: hypothetical protein IKZ87_01730, partial [Actinomycetaceae bacterium]|nr:hypothetical protein [Actinomycetaceae bacterium]
MSFFRKKVSARYLVHGALPAVHQTIINYYASRKTQLFPQPQTAPQSVNFGYQSDMSMLSWGESVSIALTPA